MNIEELIQKAKTYLSTLNEKRLRDAFELAQKAHAGQTRMGGEPYITHPFRVAMTLTDYKADEDSLIVGLLHDVVEDTDYPLSDIEQRFGPSVARMVDALTKLPKVHAMSGDGETADIQTIINTKTESIRKIFEVMQDDVRVIVIKLIDRLHNMTTVQHFRDEKRKRIAQETLDIFVKIADRLCMNEVKEKLEEYCYQYLVPDLYQQAREELKKGDPAFQNAIRKETEKSTSISLIKRAQSIHFRQIIRFECPSLERPFQYKILNELYVILEKPEDCFLALHALHSQFKNLRESVRDFISIPKTNGYQALETTLLTADGFVVRCYLMSARMHEYFQRGVMLDCFQNHQKKIKLPWIDVLRRIHQETKDKSEEYRAALENDLLEEFQTVYFSGNKSVTLPLRATALDAAFYAYQTVAYKVKQIFLNGMPAPLFQMVKQDDTIHCEFDSHSQVTHEWLKWVDTTVGMSFIQDKIRQLPIPEKIQIGKDLLQETLNNAQIGFLDEISASQKMKIAETFGKPNWSAVLSALADRTIAPEVVMKCLFQKKLFLSQQKIFLLTIARQPDQSLSNLEVLIDQYRIKAELQKTIFKKDYYEDTFRLFTNLIKIKPLLKIISSSYQIIQFNEYLPRKRLFVYLCLLILIVVWAFNPFIVKFLLGQGMWAINISFIRMLVAAGTLFVFNWIRQARTKIQYEALHFSPTFFLISLFLLLNNVFSHFAIGYLPRSYYLAIMESGHLFALFITMLLNFQQQSRRAISLISISILLTLSAFGTFVWNIESSFLKTGYQLTFIAMTAFFLYSIFNQRYQISENIKNRALFQLSYIFLFGAILQIPFIRIGDFYSLPWNIIALAIFNGFLAGALGHFIYFYLSLEMKPHLIIFGLSFMIPLAFVTEFVFFQLPLTINIFALIFIFFSHLLMALYFKWTSNIDLRIKLK